MPWLQRFVGGEDARREHEIAHQRGTADLEQARGATRVGDHAVRELGQPELGVVGREQHVAEERALHIPPMHQPWIAHTIGTRGGTRNRCVLPCPNAMYW